MGRSGRLGGDRVGPATAAREGEEGAAAAEGPGGGEGEGWWGMESLGYGARGDAVAGGGDSPVRPDGGEAQRPEEGARRIEVYRGVLPNGQLIAVKRSEQGSLQGSLEFRTEIELLSRVHHKNLVSLVGFCFDQGEQMLIYEYAPNGTLKDSLTGKSGVRLDWKRRLRVVLSAAKGIAYLHELADPPIVHRDIKSSNILLDERLNAKVSDFGLSKPLVQDGRGLVTTQVKGTMGYLDPEYYMTQQLTEKSDVYSFGVLLLEVISAKKPLERGRYIVREVKGAIDRAKDLYGLHELLDPVLGLGTSLGGFEQYVDLALRCVEEAGVDRPSMSEAVTEIERIMKIAGMKPAAESESNSMSSASRTPRHPYSSGDVQFDHSGGAPSSRVEPK